MPRQVSIREKFPSPWRVRETPGGFGVEDSTGRNLLHVYGDEGLRGSVMGLAVNLVDGKRVLAAGPGVLLSTDGGESWRQALELGAGAGPIAWSRSSPKTAFVVGFDRSLYRSDDAGESWTRVTTGKGG